MNAEDFGAILKSFAIGAELQGIVAFEVPFGGGPDDAYAVNEVIKPYYLKLQNGKWYVRKRSDK